MSSMKVIRNMLKSLLDNIDAGNSNMTEEEMEETIEFIKDISNRDKYYSKEEAAKYLHMSVQNFDLLRKKGEIPEGIKRAGITNLLWSKKVLDKYIEEHKVKKSNKYCTR